MSENVGSELKVLIEIRNWLRVGFFDTAKRTLAATLDTEQKRNAYALADGNRATDTIRQASKMGYLKAVALFEQCGRLGLAELLPGNRWRALFDLADFGLLPEVTGQAVVEERKPEEARNAN